MSEPQTELRWLTAEQNAAVEHIQGRSDHANRHLRQLSQADRDRMYLLARLREADNEIATLRETVANVSDAIAEYCARNGDKDMPQGLAEAVRSIGRAGLPPPSSAGETGETR